ncbi:MAG TPA: hypothetical protein ENN99_01650 [Chloroflexi bacterium]|nr:hypothetical protein [Chloroflexota bacterium]
MSDHSHAGLAAEDPGGQETGQEELDPFEPRTEGEARQSELQELLFQEAAVIAQNLRESGTRR